MDINEILNTIHSNHYIDTSSSKEVTSSHWKLYDRNAPIINNEGKVELGLSCGFGDYIPRTLPYTIKYMIPLYLLRWYLKKYVENQNLINIAREICKRTNKHMTFDCCKQIVLAERILRYGNIDANSDATIAVIGDGYGFLGTFFKAINKKFKIIEINLGRQLLYDARHIQEYFGSSVSYELAQKTNLPKCEADFIFLEAENYKLLGEFKTDLLISVASMQEMSNEAISNYFDIIRDVKEKFKTETMFYSLNRLEKHLPCGEITRAKEYPWGNARIIVESTPEWYSCYPSYTPPFWHKLDGPMYERYVFL